MSALHHTRTQSTTAYMLILLALWMVVPIDRPTLWILEEWGGLRVAAWIWALVFGVTGVGVIRSRSRRWQQVWLNLAFVLLCTVYAAVFATWGMSAPVLMALPLLISILGTARDVRGDAHVHDVPR